jgi:hypothetical protein
MPNAALAEWLIACFTDRGRAASAVGDLLELAPERGSFWFWSCIAGIILSFTGRRFFAFAIAYLSLVFVNALSFRLLAPVYYILTAHNNLANNWIPFLAISVASPGALVADAAAYVAICRGLRDELTRLLFGEFGLYSGRQN